MELSIRTHSIELTDEVRDLVNRRVHFALDAFGDRVEDTLVYLMDMNGPRGGVAELCQITIRAHRVGDVVVRETGTTVAAALNRAARRVKYRLSEALRRADRPSSESIPDRRGSSLTRFSLNEPSANGWLGSAGVPQFGRCIAAERYNALLR